MTTELRQYIDARFDRLEAATLIGSKETLTIEEAALYTGYKVKGLYTLTSQKRIPHYKKNGKLYFDKQELDAWMKANKVKTATEINSQAETYTVTHNRKRQ